MKTKTTTSKAKGDITVTHRGGHIAVSEPHVVSNRKFTVQTANDDINGVLGQAERMLPRKDYIDLLVRIVDSTQERLDAKNEEIAKELHEDRDVE